MILILIFAEAIGLYGLIVSIIMIFWAIAAFHLIYGGEYDIQYSS
jgi:hypothetical protein